MSCSKSNDSCKILNCDRSDTAVYSSRLTKSFVKRYQDQSHKFGSYFEQ